MEGEIKSLDDALLNLTSLEKDLGEKFELRILGTVVQGTICFLTIAANTLDHGQRRLKFNEKGDWNNLMAFINRAFYANLHTAIEVSRLRWCCGWQECWAHQRTYFMTSIHFTSPIAHVCCWYALAHPSAHTNNGARGTMYKYLPTNDGHFTNHVFYLAPELGDIGKFVKKLKINLP